MVKKNRKATSQKKVVLRVDVNHSSEQEPNLDHSPPREVKKLSSVHCT